MEKKTHCKIIYFDRTSAVGRSSELELVGSGTVIPLLLELRRPKTRHSVGTNAEAETQIE